MNTLSTHIKRTIFMGGDLGDVEVEFSIYIDRNNAAVLAVAEGLSEQLTLRDHPIGPSILAVRDANLGYRAAVNEGKFDALATYATRSDVGLEADFPTTFPDLIGLEQHDDEGGSDPDEGNWDEDAAADAELERREQLAAQAWR